MTGKNSLTSEENAHNPARSYSFLAGGGEMGALTRALDWSKTALNTPDTWPQSLRTTLSILLNSKFPMFLFWGEQHLCFYNDAYRPSLGNEGKHPLALGQPGDQVWPEIWDFIKPLIDQVLSGQEATWSEDQLLPIYRNGRLEDVYWTFSYSPVSDESGNPAGVFVTCTETTQKVKTFAQLIESKTQLEFAIEATELGTWDLNPVTGKFIGNDRLKEWFGLPPEAEIPLTWAIDVIAEKDRERVATAIERALEYSSGGHYDIEYTILNPTTQQSRIVRAKGKAWFHDDQTSYRFNGTLQDITEQATAQRKVAESELQSRSLVEQSPVRTVLLTGEEMIITRANEPVLRSWGKDASVIGRPLLEVLPEMQGQPFPKLLADVYATGKPYTASDAPVTYIRDGLKDVSYYDLTYQPMQTTSGVIYGVLSTAVDVTEKVKARMRLEESERKLRSIILQSPVAMSISRGASHIVEIANERMFEIWNRSPEAILNKPIFESLPEVKGQGFEALLHHVYTTGEIYRANELPVTLSRNGELRKMYLNLVCETVREGDGTIYGLMQVAIDVTEQVIARQQIEAAESTLRNAIDLAELGTWSYDIATRRMTYSQRMLDWYGFDKPVVPIEEMIDAFDVPDQARHKRIPDHFVWNDEGVVDDEHAIINHRTGIQYIIHSVGKRIENDAGIAVRIEGTSRDVTLERNMQHMLERQVQERTEELEAINEELAANNEELAAASEEVEEANRGLEEANLHLTRSNQNLEQFAYIASHDLQEPLRKIQQFGDLLRRRYTNSSDEELLYLERMQSAASRMSLLIKDLLSFSRISTRQVEPYSVALNNVIEEAQDNLSVIIEESNAHIQVGILPTVQGDKIQLSQLFQNLLSNAIKFSRRAQASAPMVPQIIIQASQLRTEDLPASVKPTRQTRMYHHIEVKDNGIGFDEKYTDRIFQVFQRLHSKNEFAGTGIGLAICHKVAANHGGAITATSQPGQGSTFSVYLPI
ncbi:PAS domain-containing protein [Spirosoma sp. HMF4905]|uniref:histidine kinase n=1 Tax=Spirosoma arboris TaxID=2682092 RepID=A0A7K1S4W7_9BACT|nr:PAS domain-containing protein [Spirosoma arboris]MVM28859.1 PAS domain-containing protein [Spirosoma arboris]